MANDTISKPGLALTRSLYERDEHQWLNDQISALRREAINELDKANLIVYLTEMTIRDRREMKSHFKILLMHLLKVQLQPERLTKSWVDTIRAEQAALSEIIEDTPSLAVAAPELMRVSYPRAVNDAVRETGLEKSLFPVTAPWTLDEILAFVPPEPPLHPSMARKE